MKRQYSHESDDEEMSEQDTCLKRSRTDTFIPSTETMSLLSKGRMAASSGNLHLLQEVLQQNSHYLYEFLEDAAEHGQSQIIDFLLEYSKQQPKKLHRYNVIAEGAAKGGQLHIMEQAIKMGGKVSYAISGAARVGNLQLYKLLRFRDPEYEIRYEDIYSIASSGNLEFMKYIRETENFEVEETYSDSGIQIAAASSGNLDLVKYLMSYQLLEQLKAASSSGRQNILNYLLSICTPDSYVYTQMAIYAASGQQKDVLMFCINQGASKQQIIDQLNQQDRDTYLNILSI